MQLFLILNSTVQSKFMGECKVRLLEWESICSSGTLTREKLFTVEHLLLNE